MTKSSIPWALQLVSSVHPCKVCTIRMDPDQPRICARCLLRPESKPLLSKPAFMYRTWTHEEKRKLRDLWSLKTTKEISLALDRSLSGVSAQARKLELSKKTNGCGNKKYFWTEGQDELLRAKYSHYRSAIDGISRLLPQYPRWQIRRRAILLGLTRTKEPNWTKRQERILRDWLPHRSLDWIAKKLKRSRTAIVVKSKRLGICKSKAGFTACGLAIILGADPKTITRWIERGLLAATRRQTRRNSRQHGDFFYIDPSAARDFIRDNPDEISIRTVAKRPFIELLTYQKETSDGKGKDRQSVSNSPG